MIFFSFARQECEKRFPAKLSSTRLVFLFKASRSRDSIYSLKKLSDNFTALICLSLCRASIKCSRPWSFKRQDEKSNFLSLVCGRIWAKCARISSPKKFLLQTSVVIFVWGSTSHKAWNPWGPISFKLMSSSLSVILDSFND